MTPKQLDQDLVYKFINCISIYPVGSLVQLSDGKVGLVEASNKKHPLNPEVKCFYSNKYERFIEVTSVHLNQSDLKIDHAISHHLLVSIFLIFINELLLISQRF